MLKPESLYIKKSNKAVLIFHAYTGSPNDVRSLARKIEREGYSIYTPMFSGHGTQDPMNILNQTGDDWLSDAHEAMNFLVSEGHDDIAVFGLSMGGVYAMKLIESYPDIFVGGGSFSSPLVPDEMINIYPSFLKYCEYLYSQSGLAGIELANKIENIKEPLKKQMKEINQVTETVELSLPYVEKPIFLAQSGKDELINAQAVYKAASKLTHALVETHWYPNSTHVITISKDKFKFEKDVIHFIHQLPWK